MKNVLFAIFAHPDDESFGPSGFLIQQAMGGTDIYIICVTDGNAWSGTASIRETELKAAAQIIGAKDVRMFNKADGSLCNNMYQEMVSFIELSIAEVLNNYSDPATVSFLTYENNGVTGHLDHIAVSLITTHVFTHLLIPKGKPITRGQLRYFCLCDAQKKEDLDYFVYSPKGRPEEQIDETYDVSDVLDIKKRAITAHASQPDARRVLQLSNLLLSKEHFTLYKG